MSNKLNDVTHKVILLAIITNKPLLKQNKIKSILTHNVKYLLILYAFASCQCFMTHIIKLLRNGKLRMLCTYEYALNWNFQKENSFCDVNFDYVADNQLTFDNSCKIYFICDEEQCVEPSLLAVQAKQYFSINEFVHLNLNINTISKDLMK